MADRVIGTPSGKDNIGTSNETNEVPKFGSLLNEVFDVTCKQMGNCGGGTKILGVSMYLLKERMLPPEYRHKPEEKAKPKR